MHICKFLHSQLSERERSASNRIEIARGEVAMEWESRLMEEMTRLKMELEQVHIDDRNAALNELKNEQLLESQTLALKLKQREETFNEEVTFSRLFRSHKVFLKFLISACNTEDSIGRKTSRIEGFRCKS